MPKHHQQHRGGSRGRQQQPPLRPPKVAPQPTQPQLPPSAAASDEDDAAAGEVPRQLVPAGRSADALLLESAYRQLGQGVKRASSSGSNPPGQLHPLWPNPEVLGQLLEMEMPDSLNLETVTERFYDDHSTIDSDDEVCSDLGIPQELQFDWLDLDQPWLRAAELREASKGSDHALLSDDASVLLSEAPKPLPPPAPAEVPVAPLVSLVPPPEFAMRLQLPDTRQAVRQTRDLNELEADLDQLLQDSD